MTVADNTSRNQYTATSGQTVFAYTFEIVDKDDIVVLKNGTTLSEGTNYTVSNVGNDSGGNVTLTVGATAGDILTLYRDMPYARTQNYTNSGDFLASEVNSDFDNLWLAGEQTNRSFSQSIRKPITDSESISMELPAAASRTNSFLTFDSTGAVSTSPLSSALSPSIIARQQFTGNGSTTAFTLAADPGSAAAVVIYIDGVYQEQGTYSVSGTTLTFTEAPPTNASIEVVSYKVSDLIATDAANVTYLPAGTGAVQTTVQTKLRESVSVKDFGAVGDGTTDDTAAIQAAINASSAIETIDGETYKVTSLTIASSLSILGGGTIKGSLSGSKPTRSSLVSDGSSGARLTSLGAYYQSSITLSANIDLGGDVTFKDILIKGTSRTLSVQGSLDLDNCGFHSCSLNAERACSIYATNSLISTDAPSTALFCTASSDIFARSSIIVSPVKRGASVYRGGTMDLTSSEIYNTGSDGLYINMGGTIIAKSATVSGSTGNGALINYGGTIDVSSATITANTAAGLVSESQGAIYADSTSVTNNGTSGLFVTYDGLIQANAATITGNGTYGAYARDSGVINLDSATVNTTNTGVSGQIIRSIGSGYIYAEEPGTGGFATLNESHYFPGYNRQSSSGSYIGENIADNAKMTAYALLGPDSPPNAVIASGLATPVSSWSTVDTEGAASTDDLADISPANTHIWYVRTASSGRDVTLKHNATATNPILLNGGVDKTLTNLNAIIVLIYNPASGYWIEPL